MIRAFIFCTLFCLVQANLLEKVWSKKNQVEAAPEEVKIVSDKEDAPTNPQNDNVPKETFALALQEGQDTSSDGENSSEVVIRAKRYYGCGCGCCGCGTMAPAATMMPCGCGCGCCG
ncbi:unnamed protein product [Caenorhabditis auriculariae]|uniref:Uncharacterized protein n=1 Tax=Caenorhabditis auriculariae TaxID=2777116 RepID=A0A8S1GV32_9PELO|nr:unnamed protein product [Caenorhabditis auriculariae]